MLIPTSLFFGGAIVSPAMTISANGTQTASTNMSAHFARVDIPLPNAIKDGQHGGDTSENNKNGAMAKSIPNQSEGQAQ